MSDEESQADSVMRETETVVARLEALLDQALDGSFPASDPPSSMRVAD